jgi:hypothetical protein
VTETEMVVQAGTTIGISTGIEAEKVIEIEGTTGTVTEGQDAWTGKEGLIGIDIGTIETGIETEPRIKTETDWMRGAERVMTEVIVMLMVIITIITIITVEIIKVLVVTRIGISEMNGKRRIKNLIGNGRMMNRPRSQMSLKVVLLIRRLIKRVMEEAAVVVAEAMIGSQSQAEMMTRSLDQREVRIRNPIGKVKIRSRMMTVIKRKRRAHQRKVVTKNRIRKAVMSLSQRVLIGLAAMSLMQRNLVKAVRKIVRTERKAQRRVTIRNRAQRRVIARGSHLKRMMKKIVGKVQRQRKMMEKGE